MDWAKRFIARISQHELLILSASLAYTTALALAPFLIIVLAILTFLPLDLRHQLVHQLATLLGSEAGDALTMIITEAKKESHLTGFAGALSALVLAVSASAIFRQIRIALDKVQEHKTNLSQPSGWKTFLTQEVFSIGLVFGFIFLLITSLVITTAIAATFRGSTGLLWQFISLFTNLVLFSTLFTAIFHFIPTDKLPWRRAWGAGLVATAFFLVGKQAIGFYLGRSAVGSAYGAAGSFVVLLVWLYYTAITLLLSYEFLLSIRRTT